MSTRVFRKLVQRIREEVEALPDFDMSAGEAARFWGLDSATGRRVLAELHLAGALAREGECRYYAPRGRADGRRLDSDY